MDCIVAMRYWIKSIAICCLILCCPLAAIAQNTEDAVKLERSFDLRSASPKESIALLNEIDVNNLSKKERDLYQYLLNYSLFISGKYEEALLGLNSLTGNEVSADVRHLAMSSLVGMYAAARNWTLGFKSLESLLNEINSIVDLRVLEQAHLSIMVFYNQSGEHELAAQYAYPQLNDSKYSLRFTCAASMHWLTAQVKVDISKLSEQTFSDIIEKCSNSGEPVLVTGIDAFYAEYNLQSGNPDKALAILESNIELVEQIAYPPISAEYYQLLAQSHFAAGNFDEANRYAERLVDGDFRNANPAALVTAYRVLSTNAEQQNALGQALEYLKKYEKIKQLNIDQEKAKSLNIQRAKLDAVEKSNQIALLDKENALLRAEAQLHEETEFSRLLMIILLTLLLTGVIFWIYRKRRTYAKFRKMAQTDDLTGIANRRHFTEQANSVIKYCQNTSQPISFILFDLDYFKSINDSYGHQVGDDALKIAVDAAHKCCRQNDLIGRLGGEEFGILLPSCTSAMAIKLAEQCREAIESAGLNESKYDFVLTASFGIADSNQSEYNWEKLFACADTALYESKNMGRNRVVCYENEPILERL